MSSKNPQITFQVSLNIGPFNVKKLNALAFFISAFGFSAPATETLDYLLSKHFLVTFPSHAIITARSHRRISLVTDKEIDSARQ